MKILLSLCFFLSSVFALDLNFKNFSSDFTQSIKSKNSLITYKGHFILEQDKAFWSYDSPTKKEIYINKNQVIIVEHDLEQVIFSKLDNTPNLNEIFKNAKKLDENKLQAKYKNITYLINLENDEVKNISYKDEFDNIVNIELYEQKRNLNIDENIFKAKYPKTYDLIN